MSAFVSVAVAVVVSDDLTRNERKVCYKHLEYKKKERKKFASPPRSYEGTSMIRWRCSYLSERAVTMRRVKPLLAAASPGDTSVGTRRGRVAVMSLDDQLYAWGYRRSKKHRMSGKLKGTSEGRRHRGKAVAVDFWG